MRELPRLLVAYTWAATKSRLLLRDYQYAVLYILSVSGLHMGFIPMFMTLVLKPIPNNKKGSWIKLLLY
jgi:hypothetical protein